MVIKIFTDGSALSNSSNAKAGAAMYIPSLNIVYSKYMRGTNNQAELSAILFALRYIEKFSEKEYEFYTDSMYCINILTKTKTAKKNKELIKEIFDLIDSLNINITFIHVRAHTKSDTFESKCNAIVDKKAREAALKCD
jgi:ribonuclease HI